MCISATNTYIFIIQNIVHQGAGILHSSKFYKTTQERKQI